MLLTSDNPPSRQQMLYPVTFSYDTLNSFNITYAIIIILSKETLFSASRLPHCGAQSDPTIGKSCTVRGVYIVRAMNSDGGVPWPPVQAPPSSCQGGTCLGTMLFLICYEHACPFYTTCF